MCSHVYSCLWYLLGEVTEDSWADAENMREGVEAGERYARSCFTLPPACPKSRSPPPASQVGLDGSASPRLHHGILGFQYKHGVLTHASASPAASPTASPAASPAARLCALAPRRAAPLRIVSSTASPRPPSPWPRPPRLISPWSISLRPIPMRPPLVALLSQAPSPSCGVPHP